MPYTPANFTLECTARALQDRLETAHELAKTCKELQNVIFCPTNQDLSFVQAGNGEVWAMGSECERPRLLWETFG